MRKPWPTIGQRISLTYQSLRLVGIVTDVTWENVEGCADTFWCEVGGNVEEFEAQAPLEDE